MGFFFKEKQVEKVCNIPVDQIHPNPDQPRRIFEKEELQALAESIGANGLLQPVLLLREEGGEYRIIAGERRWIACQMLGMETIPGIVREATQEDAAVWALIENIQRSDLNFLEEAAAIQKLMQKLSLTQEQVAKRLGKSQSAVANKLRLLRLPEEVQQLLVENQLSERHARALLKLPPGEMLGAAQTIVEDDLTVAQTERYVEELREKLLTPEESPKPGQRGKKIFVVKDIRIFTNTIARAIETMKGAGIDASSQKVEYEGYVEYIVRIPKKPMYIREKAKA